MPLASVALAVHAAAAVFLVGGLMFALIILKPGAQALDERANLTLWRDSLRRFLARSWIAVVLLLASGYGLIHLIYGSLPSAPRFVRAMGALALAIAAVLAYVQFFPWRAFREAVAASTWPTATRKVSEVRTALAILMVLGLLAVLIGSAGRYFS